MQRSDACRRGAEGQGLLAVIGRAAAAGPQARRAQALALPARTACAGWQAHTGVLSSNITFRDAMHATVQHSTEPVERIHRM